MAAIDGFPAEHPKIRPVSSFGKEKPRKTGKQDPVLPIGGKDSRESAGRQPKDSRQTVGRQPGSLRIAAKITARQVAPSTRILAAEGEIVINRLCAAMPGCMVRLMPGCAVRHMMAYVIDAGHIFAFV